MIFSKVLTILQICLVSEVFSRLTDNNRLTPSRSNGQSGRNNYHTPASSNLHNNGSVMGSAIKIIGGEETERYEFPFIVSFSRQKMHFCGGSIISPEWILTAAHCASEPDFAVTAGEHNLDVSEGTEQNSRAMKVIRHPNYNPVTYEDDICLVKVSPPFAFNEYVKHFAVPSTHYVADGDATVAGWGTEDEAYQIVSPVLRKVSIPLVQSIECAKQYGGYFLPMKMICAGEEEGGKDACQGDSGGPLMCKDYEKGATLCGVVSFGLGCARPELAGVYTKVAYYSDWIDFEIKRNSDGKAVTPPTRPPKPTTVRNRYQETINLPIAPTYNPSEPKKPTIPPGYEVIIIRPQNNSTNSISDHNHNHNHYHDHGQNSYPPRKGAAGRLSSHIPTIVVVLLTVGHIFF